MIHVWERVVRLSLSPFCVTRDKKPRGKERPRKILGARIANFSPPGFPPVSFRSLTGITIISRSKILAFCANLNASRIWWKHLIKLISFSWFSEHLHDKNKKIKGVKTLHKQRQTNEQEKIPFSARSFYQECQLYASACKLAAHNRMTRKSIPHHQGRQQKCW